MTDGASGAVLTVNAGSSSIKLAVFDAAAATATPQLTALVERIGTAEASAEIRLSDGARLPVPLEATIGAAHETALGHLLPLIAEKIDGAITAAGHRIVHGGDRFTDATVIDEDVLAALERLVPLARTHQPHGIAAIRAVAGALPQIPQIACFDTGFHATIPVPARTFALPQSVRSAGVRRYGFHGLSYQWVAGLLPGLLGDRADGRIVVAHLGNGASLCGLVGRESRATTMGFTPLDGLVMGERPGLTDPGAVLFMIEEMGMDVPALRETLFRRSGLLGLSGISNDMRRLLASDAAEARLALDVYVHRIAREIGAIAAEIGGIDALVFTGGVGEHAAPIRSAIVSRLDWLGFSVDPALNDRNAACISTDESRPVVIVAANEEAVIATATRGVVAGLSAGDHGLG
ncbi:MAG: acetate/propionate family kinase [Pseudomonadota bacterium]